MNAIVYIFSALLGTAANSQNKTVYLSCQASSTNAIKHDQCCILYVICVSFVARQGNVSDSKSVPE
jgi:hypothetical protein